MIQNDRAGRRESGEALRLPSPLRMLESSVDKVAHQRPPSLVLDSTVMDFRVLDLSILFTQQGYYYSASAFGIMLSCLPVCC